MTASLVERNTHRMLPGLEADPIADNVKVLLGTLVMLVAGYATPGATGTTGICCGRARKTYDNTVVGHTLGALTVETEEGCFPWVNGDTIVQADVGKVAYMADNQTVTKAGSGKSPAGIIRKVDARGVWVESSKAISVALAIALAAEPAATITTGTATLTSGTVTVAQTAVGAGSVILVSRKSKAGSTALGELSTPTRTANTSFVIIAQKPADGTTETGDASTVDYTIIG